MTLATASGTLQGLTVVDREDLSRYKAAVAAGRQDGWSYYLPFLLSRNKPGRSAVYITEDEGSLCLFRWRGSDDGAHLDLVCPPIPMNVAALERSLERANDFNGDRSARVVRIDDKDAVAVRSLPALRVTQRRSQYVYAPSHYESLPGTRYHTVRRNVARVQRLPDVTVVPYTAEHAAGCQALLARWQQDHRVTHGTAGGTDTSKTAIALAGAFPNADLCGEVVIVNGRVAAFAFGGEIRPGLACAFERKCDTNVAGLSYFHFRSFLLSLRTFELVNDGSDAKRAGLRQLKESLRPVAMHAEHRATQVASP